MTNSIHHNHNHSHDVSHLSGRKLLWVSILNFSITLFQIVGGIISNSLSLLSDAVHNLGDSTAIFIAFIANKVSRKNPDESHTFGYKRIEILAALFNATVLIAISVFLFYEAYSRFLHPEPIKGKVMFIVACFGLLANLISVVILNDSKNHNLNVKAAYLHLMGDTLSSVAVILGGIAIWKWNIIWIDPLVTVLVSVYIIYHTWHIVKQTVDILMQKVPDNIDVKEIKRKIELLEEVHDIHHLHVWRLDDNIIHLETHINLEKNVSMKEMMSIKHKIEELIHENFHISHTTCQMEFFGDDNERKLIVN
ncbi:MAG: cation diffusion facilitator family transporter [Bacteroidales bacterium]